MKILIPIDNSDDSNEAIEQAAARPWPSGSEIKIIHIVESAIPPLPDLMGVGAEAARINHEEASKKGTELLNEMAGKIRKDAADNLTVTEQLITAPYQTTVPQVIVEEAKSFEADLIIVGSRGMSRWKRFLLGSVSKTVVEHAPCSVEVVRSKG